MAQSLVTKAIRPFLAAPHDSPAFICNSYRRHESSFRRTRKALRIKPDPSFELSKTEYADHIIFNPPSSAPSVYHTPSKFLPSSDPRRQRLQQSTPRRSAAPTPTPTLTPTPSAANPLLPPPVRTPYEKKYHLTEEQIAEIRRLRAEDPRQWTRVRLAEKFECSQFFVSLCCCAPEIKREQDRALAATKKRWGRKKTEAREDRQIRKAMWGREA